jgi:release factor glutamine methyltransferase
VTTRGALLRDTVERLRMAKAETPELDARVLLKEALNLTDAELIAAQDGPASPDGVTVLESMVCRRIAGEPVARILGHKEFWGLRFRLGIETLVPRPDTETLIEATLAAFGRGAPERILDLGTGTGCLLLAALSEFSSAVGVGVDVSPGAVAVAQNNATLLGLAERTQFTVSNWDSKVEGHFDLILCNPPYIRRKEISFLEREVRLHDPELALDGGQDGLDAYRKLAEVAVRRLLPGGLLIVELGAGQEAEVASIVKGCGLTVDGPARCDLGGIPRALVVRR